MARSIVFLTDYGLADGFVGICHGVMARIAPEARVVDLTHAIPRQDVMRGALALGRATDFMPDAAVYVAVVDPGVGSERRSIAVRAGSGAFLVGPDNGLLSMAWDALGGRPQRPRSPPRTSSSSRCRRRSTAATCSPPPPRTSRTGSR